MLISGIVVLVLGMMLVDFNRVALKGTRSRDLGLDYRFAKEYLQRELVKARDYAIVDDGAGLNLTDENDDIANIVFDESAGTLTLSAVDRGALLLNNLEDVKFFLGTDFEGNILDNLMSVHTLQRQVAVHTGDPEDSVVVTSSATFSIYMRSLDR